MSEAMEFNHHSSPLPESLLVLMLDKAPRAKAKKHRAISSHEPVNLTAVPEPKPLLFDTVRDRAETTVLLIENSFSVLARITLEASKRVILATKRYTKFALAWIRYGAITFLIYATDNRRKGALLKLTGVSAGTIIGCLAGLWASSVVSAALSGKAGYLLGLFIGSSLILAFVDMGKKLGAAIAILKNNGMKSRYYW